MKMIVIVALILTSSLLYSEKDTQKEIINMSLEQLMNVEVISASNKKEKLQLAPANVIVLTGQEILERGYTDLVEMFNDLPGIDLSVTYGDLYYRAYWRGYRKGLSVPFLLMLDGMTMNHLWYNWADILIAIPLSNIRSVEIVYGPASSVYGPNAMMGVVNIRTIKDPEKSGTTIRAKLSRGSFDTYIADLSFMYKKEDFRFSATGFINHGDLDKDSLNSYEYTKPQYLKDRKLWGGFIDNPDLAGTVSSPRRTRSINLSLFFKDLEIGAQYFRVGNMSGVNYPFDRYQSIPTWVEEDYHLYIRNKYKLGSRVSAETILRYRESNVPSETISVEARGGYGEERKAVYVAWQSLNSSWSVNQDFEIDISRDIQLKTGIKYEELNLQKAYDHTFGPTLTPDRIDLNTYPFPSHPTKSLKSRNRATWRDQSAYIQSRFNLSPAFKSSETHHLHLGLRFDDSSNYGTNHTIRAAYIATAGKFTFKALYGEAFQAPNPRILYGGWSGAGSSPSLKPERSRTMETVINYTASNHSLLINPYYVKVKDTINSFNGVPKNIGEREMYGFDMHGRLHFDIDKLQCKLWTYYSFIQTEESKYHDNELKAGTGEIGDIADHKIFMGLTVTGGNLTSTFRCRYIGKQNTFDTNPIREIDNYFTADLTLLYRNFLTKGVSVSLKINNIFDKEYFHSGIRSADAGDTPGFWEDGKWYGSRGWQSSILPQQGRSIILSLIIGDW